MTRSVSRIVTFLLCLMAACTICLAPSLAFADEANAAVMDGDVNPTQPASGEDAGADAEGLSDDASGGDATDVDTPTADAPAADSSDADDPDGTDIPALETPNQPAVDPSGDEDATASDCSSETAGDADESAQGSRDIHSAAPQSQQPSQPRVASTSTALATVTAPPATSTATAVKASQAPAKAAAATEGPIASGTYVIDSAKAKSLMVDVADNSKKANADVRFVTDSGKKSQQWTFTYNAAKNAYTISNANSNKYLAAASAKAGANVFQAAKKTASKLQWWIISKVGSAFKIASLANAKLYLDVKGGKPTNGATVTLQKSSNTASQKFYLLGTKVKKPAGTVADYASGVYTVGQSASASNVLNVEGAEQVSGANVNVATTSGAGSQKWYLKNLGKGLYSLVNIQTGKALEVTGRAVNSNVDQAAVTSSAKQKWYLISNDDGSISLVSKYNGLMLRTSGFSTKSGTNVLAGLTATGAAQKFVTRTTDLVESGYYSIALRKKNTNALSIPDSSRLTGKQLVTAAYDGSLNQKYQVVKEADGSLTIMALVSGKYLADNGAGKLVQSVQRTDSSQRWTARWNGTAIVLRNAATGKSIYLAKPTKENQKAATNSKASGLVLAKGNIIDNGAYFLQTALGTCVAGAKNGSNANKANVILDANINAQYQKYNITYLGNGAYKILNAYGNKALTVASTSKKANVSQKKYTGADTQKWVVEVSPQGGLVFVNKASGMALDVAGGKSKNGANVDARTKSTSAAAERWNIVATIPLTALQLKGYNKIANRVSKTNYAISVDLTNHWVWVFERKNKNAPWNLKYEWRCSNGAKESPTPAVNKLMSGYRKYKGSLYDLEGNKRKTSFYYLTNIDGGKYFHSPIYHLNSTTWYSDRRMGMSISHGCVRLETKNAIWIYNNIKKGTRLATFY